MLNLSDKCLATIKAHKQEGIDFNPDFIFPYFDGYSVANIPSSLFHSLGLTFRDSKSLDDSITESFKGEFDDVVLLVVDSLGLHLFNRWLDHIKQNSNQSCWNPLLELTTLAYLTSTIPSTTTTVLTTLWTGMEASRHGLVGYEMWLKEYGVIANMISHAPVDQADDIGSLCKLGFDPLKFLPVECVGSKLRKCGVETYVYLHASIAGSGLSQMLMTDTKIIAWRTYNELWQYLLEHAKLRNQKTYTNIYVGDIDTLSHRRGPKHELVWQAWLDFSNQLADYLLRLKTTSKRKILFLLTADHGQVDQEIRDEFELKHHPELLKMLKRMPSGESRLPYLYPLQGYEDEINSYIQKTWPEKFNVLCREDFIAAGVFGSENPSEFIKERIGELVVIPTGKDYLRWAPKENHLLGRHGGFLPDEMLVPLMAIQL